MKKLVTLLFMACASISWSQETKSQAPEFIVKAANARLASSEAGRYAASLGTTQALRDFGSEMMKDEEAMRSKLKTLAVAKGITLPNAIGEKKGEQLMKLSKLTGAQFDRKFLKWVKSTHKHDIKQFKKAAEYDDAATKEFAASNIAMLEKHLDAAKMLAKG